MRFLNGNSGQATVEWIVGLILVVAVVGTVINLIANTTANQGKLTNTWIGAIPAPK